MTNTLSKILSIVLVVLLVISLALTLWFFNGVSSLPDEADHTAQIEALAQPLGALYNWALAMMIVSIGSAILFSIANVVLNFKNSIRGLLTAVTMVAILVITYSMSDGAIFTPEQLPGYSGPDNVPGWIRLADMLLYTTYALFGISILATVYSELSKVFK